MPFSTAAFLKRAALASFALGAFATAAHAQGAPGIYADEDFDFNNARQTTPIESRSQFQGLPGVDLSDGAGRVRIQGPGGLENNVGAIGTAVPSTSSSNPLPLQNDMATTGGSVAITR